MKEKLTLLGHMSAATVPKSSLGPGAYMRKQQDTEVNLDNIQATAISRAVEMTTQLGASLAAQATILSEFMAFLNPGWQATIKMSVAEAEWMTCKISHANVM